MKNKEKSRDILMKRIIKYEKVNKKTENYAPKDKTLKKREETIKVNA